ncbi:unnamed protein product [Brassicogethes aeneus]|uniref:Phospholipase A2-like domain-containing protein n=1 Tax=Brassicogethes aeneus TaxID=1431903 RepID=A0A9P0FC87_BRAAE|nr:unnamed protein product [Brassicogethes aeneus]
MNSTKKRRKSNDSDRSEYGYIEELIKSWDNMSDMDDFDNEYDLMPPFEDRAHWNVSFPKVPTQITQGSTVNMAILPNYPHIGPGNPIYGSSSNEMDEIARKHDLAYLEAKSPIDVMKADEIFLNNMKAYEPQNSSVPPEDPEDVTFDEISQFSQGTKRTNTENTETVPSKVKVIEEPSTSKISATVGHKRPSSTEAIADIAAKKTAGTSDQGSSSSVGPQSQQQDPNPAGHSANTGGPTNTEAGIKKAQITGSLSEFK